MPFVRIDLPADTPSDELRAVSGAVHQALVDVFNVPADDLFQAISRRAPEELVCSPSYLGVAHTAKVAFVQVFCSPGRPVGLKEALYARIAAGVAQRTSFRAEDVVIHLVETLRENWSFGSGVAHYAVQDRRRPGEPAVS